MEKFEHYWYTDTQDCAHVAAFYWHQVSLLSDIFFTVITLYKRRARHYEYWADDSNP